MRVTAFEARLERLPIPRSRSLPQADSAAPGGPDVVSALVVRLASANGASGLGMAVVDPGPQTALAAVNELFQPLVAGADACDTGRLAMRARHAVPAIAHGGVEAQAWSAVDLALWDLKAQLAELPLARLLGGARDTAIAYFAETIWPGLSADQVVDMGHAAIASGATGLWVGVGGRDPVQDAKKLQQVREELGDDVWFGVRGFEGLDTNTALAFGQFLEEELDADMYADPIPSGHLEGLARLAGGLGLPVAAGSTRGAADMAGLLTRGGVPALRVDVNRVGGITPLVEIAGLAGQLHRAVMISGPPAVTVQLGCGLPAVAAVDDVRWFDRLCPAPQRVSGRLSPPAA